MTWLKALLALPAVLLGIGFLAGVAFTLSLPWVNRWLERQARRNELKALRKLARQGKASWPPVPRPLPAPPAPPEPPQSFYRGRRRAISTRES